MEKLKAVVFDMDGVIFDSERFVIECWKKVAELNNFTGIEEACKACIGTNYNRTREIMFETYGDDFPYDVYREQAREIEDQWIEEHGFPQKPGVLPLLSFLREKGIRIAIASSTKVEKVKAELADAGFLKYFQVVIGGDMVEKSKPEPDIFLKACEELGVCVADAYIIEDSYNGVRAAYRAGAMPIMVPDILGPTEEMKQIAKYIFPSLTEVLQFFKTLV